MSNLKTCLKDSKSILLHKKHSIKEIEQDLKNNKFITYCTNWIRNISYEYISFIFILAEIILMFRSITLRGIAETH